MDVFQRKTIYKNNSRPNLVYRPQTVNSWSRSLFWPRFKWLVLNCVLALCYIPMLMDLLRKKYRGLLNVLLRGFIHHITWHLFFWASLKEISLGSSPTKSIISLEYLIHYYIKDIMNHAPVQSSLFALADKKKKNLRAKYLVDL